ncbi:MAG TPA: hypothetical protein VHB20_02590 [Verrucomicrobiae bacterium]|jgi:hypothetical protein|nr:hypothetical protein [Verrucomicrobiae bacterium]
MKITITGAGLQAFLLADDAAGVLEGSGWPQGAGGQVRDGFLNQHERKIQSADLARAPYRTNTPRFNLENRLEFVVERSFSTTAGCQLFIAQHPGQIPAQGLLNVAHQAADGVVNLYLKNAVVQWAKCRRQTGVTCLFQYLVRGNSDWSTNAL